MKSTKRPPKPQLIKHVPAVNQPEVQKLGNSDAQVESYQDVVKTTALHEAPKATDQSSESASKSPEKQELFHPTPDDGKLLEELTSEQQPGHAPVEEKHLELPKVEPQVTGKRNKKKID
ncbi:hypothetical protein, partial [Nostoc commune]